MKTFGNKRLIKVWLVMGAIGAVFGAGVVAQGEVSAATSSLTVNIASSISLDLNPIYPNGTFASSSTSDNTISVKTDNFTGYTLGIAAKTANNNALTYTNNDVVVATIPSITSAVSATNYADNTYATTNHLNNTWGFRPSKYNSVDNTVTNNYYPAPTSTEENNIVLDATSVANPTTFNNYNIAIGARVNMDTQPGAYNNTFVITAVANPINYTITYDKGNTTDTVTNLPANQTGTLGSPNTATDITLTSDKPTRSGYVFTGWCTVMPTTTDGTDSCTGTGSASYAAGGNYPLNAIASPNVTLYAMWGPPPLYDLVAAMSKGKNTSANGFSWTSITKPTSTNPSTDTSTSGVYEWGGKDGTSAGTDSNGGSNPIYFYRGILDTTVATYGSDGPANAYPNYVVLSSANNKNSLAITDTCWRIVRTTSTGGVKMIYNGTWTGGTDGTCANATTTAQTMYNGSSLTVPFNMASSTKAGKTYTGLQQQNIHAVGYTYSNVAAGTTSAKTPAELFGASGNDTTTNANSSIMKKYIEDWYASTLTSYTSKLEGDAGYCQDRRLNTGTTWTTPLAENSNTIIPYGASGMTLYYFGAYPRNYQSSTFDPLLTCPRGKVDLYSYSSNAGNGNGQLTYPVALLTADEASIAGSGTSNSYNAYNANSYLRSGSIFWLLSPYFRYSNGDAYGFFLNSNGRLSSSNVYNAIGVRPAISLKPGTTAASGTGTATNPWIVNPLPSS